MKELYFESLQLSAYKKLDMAVFIKNTLSQYLWANDFFIKKSAGLYAPNDIFKKEDHDFAWHEYADALRSNDKLLFEKIESVNVCERVLRYEGTYVDIVTKKSPLFDKHKELIGLIGFSIEVPVSPVMNFLSKREYISVSLMSEGCSDKEIAKRLGISPRTVESHIINAKRKLGVMSRAELIAKICRWHP